jgi:membrane protease YdiL (CAAX protease family)
VDERPGPTSSAEASPPRLDADASSGLEAEAPRIEADASPSPAAGPSDGPANTRFVPWILWLAVAFGLAALGASVLDSLFCAFVLVGLPRMASVQLDLLGDGPIRRVPAYAGSILAMVVLAGVAMVLGLRTFGLNGLGLGPVEPGPLALWSVGLTAAGVAVVLAFHRLRLRTGTTESRLLRELLPRTRREKAGFAVLSFSAGFGEELVFRGYLLAVLAGVFDSTVVGAVIAAFVFGLVHAYQERLGMARASILGLLLSLPVLMLGNLWPAMIAHTLLDLIGGFVLADRLASDG